jgi:hypothetical protein
VFSGAVFGSAVLHYQQLLSAGLLEDASNAVWLKVPSVGSKEGTGSGVGPSLQLTRAQRAEARAAAKAGTSGGCSKAGGTSNSSGGDTGEQLGRAGKRQRLVDVRPSPTAPAAAAAGGVDVGSSSAGRSPGGSRPVLGVLGYLQRTAGAQVVSDVLDRRMTVPDALLGLAVDRHTK